MLLTLTPPWWRYTAAANHRPGFQTSTRLRSVISAQISTYTSVWRYFNVTPSGVADTRVPGIQIIPMNFNREIPARLKNTSVQRDDPSRIDVNFSQSTSIVWAGSNIPPKMGGFDWVQGLTGSDASLHYVVPCDCWIVVFVCFWPNLWWNKLTYVYIHTVPHREFRGHISFISDFPSSQNAKLKTCVF